MNPKHIRDSSVRGNVRDIDVDKLARRLDADLGTPKPKGMDGAELQSRLESLLGKGISVAVGLNGEIVIHTGLRFDENGICIEIEQL